MAELKIASLRSWPGEPTKARRSSPFQSTYSATLQLLERELGAVGAQAPVVQMMVDTSQIRLDGGLRAATRPDSPGIVLSFTTKKHGAMRFVCDRFTKWEDNLRAVALGMEALRKIDRYGITSDGEQYRGFQALTAGADAQGFASVEDAARFIAELAQAAPSAVDAMLDDAGYADVLYRRASKAAHPDAGGSDATMARLVAARAMLDGQPS